MSTGALLVKDSRTNVEYKIPIKRNAVLAADFKKIKAPSASADRADQAEGGLRIHDPGLLNTTVVESAISFSYVQLLHYRSISIIKKLTAVATMRPDCFSFEGIVWKRCGTVISKTCFIFLFGGYILLRIKGRS